MHHTMLDDPHSADVWAERQADDACVSIRDGRRNRVCAERLAIGLDRVGLRRVLCWHQRRGQGLGTES